MITGNGFYGKNPKVLAIAERLIVRFSDQLSLFYRFHRYVLPALRCREVFSDLEKSSYRMPPEGSEGYSREGGRRKDDHLRRSNDKTSSYSPTPLDILWESALPLIIVPYFENHLGSTLAPLG